MLSIPNTTSQATYVDATTFGGQSSGARFVGGVLTIANASAFVRIWIGAPGAVRPLPELFVAPSVLNLAQLAGGEPIAGVAVRSAVAATPCQFFGTLIEKTDPSISGQVFTGTVTPSGAVGAVVLITVVALAAFPPASPTDGQTIWLELPASSDPIGGKKIRWLCVFNSSDSAWDVSGPPLYAEVQTSETNAVVAGSYGDLPTVGPSITLPRPGDYEVGIGALIQLPGAQTAGFMAYLGAGIAAAADADSAQNTTANNSFGSVMRYREKVGLTTASALTAKYKNNGATAGVFANRWMSLTPIRIT